MPYNKLTAHFPLAFLTNLHQNGKRAVPEELQYLNNFRRYSCISVLCLITTNLPQLILLSLRLIVIY